MKCPKCGGEIVNGIKFCTKCGANIDEENAKIAAEEKRKQEEAEKRKKAQEEKKRLEEIRKEEEKKRQEALKEAEKAEAIRKAKEEGIEFEIIDSKPEESKKMEFEKEVSTKSFKVKKEENQPNSKKKKVRIRKNIFQILFGKLIFIVVVAALIIGGVYYAYKQKLLPNFAQEKVGEFEHTLQNVVELYKDVEEGKKNLPEAVEEEKEKENWKVEPTIEATDIRDLNEEVSVIVKEKKEGLINNQTGEIVLEPKYTQILISDYYDIDKTEAEKENGIVVKDVEKTYKLDKDYKVSTEVNLITKAAGTYYFDHHGPYIYYSNSENICTLLKADENAKGLKLCTDIDIVTTSGIAAKDADLPENFTIDFSKSTIMTKGYVDLSKADLKINCDYDEAYEFSDDGYAAVKKRNNAGIIDEDANEVLEIKYQETRSVHNKTAFVKKDGKWGIMNIK